MDGKGSERLPSALRAEEAELGEGEWSAGLLLISTLFFTSFVLPFRSLHQGAYNEA